MRTSHNTRFNPTTNGPLHLGHVYIILFNEFEAHQNGSEFIVRFEDNQPEWLNIYGAVKSRKFAEESIEALEWLGIPVDGYSYQTGMIKQVFDFARDNNVNVPRYTWPHVMPCDPTKLDNVIPLVGDWYGYTPFFTFCKVVFDYFQSIDVVMRGDDLRAEFSLYMHYAEMLGLPRTVHYYFPRLRTRGGALSKHLGAMSVLEYKRLGVKPGTLLNLLARSSLIDPAAGWYPCNVKKEPELVEEFSIIAQTA